MKYICKQEFYLEKYDDNGFPIENKYTRIPKGSIWEEDINNPKFIASEDSVHLDRRYKSNKAKTSQWIEITKEHLNEYFERYYEIGDEVTINGVRFIITKTTKRTLSSQYLISTWVDAKYFD